MKKSKSKKNPGKPATAKGAGNPGEKAPEETFIYALCCPDTGEVRYVGKSDNPKKRLGQHLRDKSSAMNRRRAWIANLLKQGKGPVLKILEKVPLGKWSEAENFWVTSFKANGSRLTNGDDGGLGGRSGIPQRRIHYLKIQLKNAYGWFLRKGNHKAADRIALKMRLFAHRYPKLFGDWKKVK